MLLRRRAATTAGLTLLWLGGPSGCYVQRPLQVGATAQPAVTPGAVVSVTLNDAGRTALAAGTDLVRVRLVGLVAELDGRLGGEPGSDDRLAGGAR